MAPTTDTPTLTEKFALAKAQVTDAELRSYSRLVYKRLGIRLSSKKKTLLSNRIMRRLRETHCETFSEYLRYLEQLDPEHEEWDAFIQEITTHETAMFREPRHWEWFEDEFLSGKRTEARASEGTPSLRIWSAACSTGEEPYTIAACIAGTIPNFRDWRIQIVGSDVAAGAIARAQRAEFSEKSMRLVPGRLRRFFRKTGNGDTWCPDATIRELVVFRRHNLLDPPTFGTFDLALVKNVLIYFDRESKRRALAAVCSALKPGGFLLTGSAEGIGDWAPECERIRPWLARIPRADRSHAEIDPAPTPVDEPVDCDRESATLKDTSKS